jgi:hypothetical protein
MKKRSMLSTRIKFQSMFDLFWQFSCFSSVHPRVFLNNIASSPLLSNSQHTSITNTLQDFYLLTYNTVQSGEIQQMFRSNKSPPSSIPKMEATLSLKTSANFQRTTGRHMPQKRTPRNHRCDNLKSEIISFKPELSWFRARSSGAL